MDHGFDPKSKNQTSVEQSAVWVGQTRQPVGLNYSMLDDYVILTARVLTARKMDCAPIEQFDIRAQNTHFDIGAQNAQFVICAQNGPRAYYTV